MKKLLLTSQGLQPEIKETFLGLLDKPVQQIKVSFITTAAYGEEPNPVWLEVYRKQLRNYGLNQIEDLDIKDKTQTELEKILSDKDIIFVNGGNTFYLLKWVKKSGFDKVIKDLINKGKLYIGVSAGSYIACPTIEQALWKQKFKDRKTHGLKDLSALNLVPFLLTAHFEENYRSIIKEASKTSKYPVVALNDTQAILVKDSKYKLVGIGKREFFNGFKEKL